MKIQSVASKLAEGRERIQHKPGKLENNKEKGWKQKTKAGGEKCYDTVITNVTG